MSKSPLECLRLRFSISKPPLLQDIAAITFQKVKTLPCDPEVSSYLPHLANSPLLQAVKGEKKKAPPLQIGAVFSGGPAAGGHNVLSGLFDACPEESSLFGFLGGPGGLIQHKYKKISKEEIDSHRNLGGFNLLGTDRTKIETPEQMSAALEICEKLQLDGLVIIGGDDSNTNAAMLAEFFHTKQSKTKIIGVPKTIDGDLQNPFVLLPFGFDTACKVYAEMVGNICKDALSTQKYTHFIKLMGRSASHIAMECALATQPNYAFIGEEVQEKRQTLSQIVSDLSDLIAERASLGKSYGVILIPEGLIEFIPEIANLIKELNKLLAKGEPSSAFSIIAGLSHEAKKCFDTLPEPIQKQLLLRRDPHGNVQVSLIETEKLLSDLVSKELEARKQKGLFSGTFSAQTHFFGYEGRCALPSNFDATYSYLLGMGSLCLIREGVSGYMTFIANLDRPLSEWSLGGVPLSSLLHMETRKGEKKPVIKKHLVDCSSQAFLDFVQKRKAWALNDEYKIPGPMQFSSEFLQRDSL
jgi:diphosphate-dependent phosphofructokinase